MRREQEFYLAMTELRPARFSQGTGPIQGDESSAKTFEICICGAYDVFVGLRLDSADFLSQMRPPSRAPKRPSEGVKMLTVFLERAPMFLSHIVFCSMFELDFCETVS